MSTSNWIPVLTCILMLLTCLTQLSSAQNRRRKQLLIAVEDLEIYTYLVNQSASKELIDSAFPYISITKISLVLVHMPVKGSLDTVFHADIVQENLTQMDVSAVISDYYISLAIATYTLGIPYFVIKKNVLSFPPFGTPNIFEIEIDNYHMGQALYDTAMVYKRTTLVVVSDGSPQSSQFLYNFAGRIFAAFLVNYNNTEKEIYSVFSRFSPNSLSSGMGWILLFDERNLPLMQRTLEVASRAGIFVSNQIFFIPTLFDKQKFLVKFYRSKIRILTFLLADEMQYSENDLRHPFVLDCLNHFLKAYRAWPSMPSAETISQAITETSSVANPRTGLYVYHPVNRVRAIVQINVVHTNESKSSNSSIYSLSGIWQEDGIGPPFKPNYAMADDITESRIVFVAFELEPYFYGYNPATGLGRGLGIEMIEVLRSRLGFEYKVIVTANRNEALQKLKTGEADVSLNFLSSLHDRQNYTDPSVDMVQDGVQMLTRKVVRGFSFRHIFQPFSIFVWIGIGITIVMMTLTLFACDKISPNTTESKQVFTLLECFYLVLSSFLLANSNMQPRKVSSRLFILLLRFSTLMYIIAYLSSQVAQLIQADQQISISSIGELDTLDGYKWGFLRNSIVAAEVQANWPKVYARALREWPSDMYFNSIQDAVNRVLSDPYYILVASADTLSYEKTKDCNLIVMGNIGDSRYLTWLFRKGFPFKDALSSQLNTEKAGVFIQMRSKYFELSRCYSGRTSIENKIQLGFEYLYGLFVLLGVGLMLGFVYLLCQWLFQRVREWWRIQRHMIHFNQDQIYKAEVVDAGNNGLWIRIEEDNVVRFINNNSLRQDNDEDANMCNTQLKGQTIRVQYVGKCSLSGARIFIKLPGAGELFTVEKSDAGSDLTQGEESCSV